MISRFQKKGGDTSLRLRRTHKKNEVVQLDDLTKEGGDILSHKLQYHLRNRT